MKSALAEGELEGRLRDQTIKRMKEKGGLAYYFRIRSTLKIREEAFEPGKTVRVYLPIPLEYAQVRNFRLLHTSMEPLRTAPPLWPQRTVCFETELTENSVFSIEYEFENHTPYIELDENRVTGAADAGKVLPDGSRLGNWLGEQLPRSGSHRFSKA